MLFPLVIKIGGFLMRTLRLAILSGDYALISVFTDNEYNYSIRLPYEDFSEEELRYLESTNQLWRLL